MPYTYLLRCAGGTYYAGWTVNMEARIAAHRAGRASRYTRSRLPVELAYLEEWPTEAEARRREAALKRLGHAAKARLCSGCTEGRAKAGTGGG